MAIAMFGEPVREWEVMRPICQEWLHQARAIRRSPKWTKFDNVAKQCRQFYSGSMGFMWDDQYRRKYLGGFDSPFKVTLNKAFELVAVFGPRMYFNNPQRDVRKRRDFQTDPAWFGQDPQSQMMLQFALQSEQSRNRRHSIQSELMRQYLNFTPDEQPRGGLRKNSMLAITESLITGRGILWPESYRIPGTKKSGTGLFWDSQENLLIDPDANSLEDALYVIKVEKRPFWEFEREFKLPRNSLKQYASSESTTRSGQRSAHVARTRHVGQSGESADLMTVYKIWSRMGVGGRLQGVQQDKMSKAFDEVVGDYAYLCVAENVPWPLNAPRKALETESEDEIRRRLSWPVEFWRDNNKWPFVQISYYDDPGSPYPIPPLAAGLGELTFMNVFISMLAGKTAASSRTLIAVAQSAAADLKQKLNSSEMFDVFEVGDLNTKIDELVKVIEFKAVNSDAYKILDIMAQSFERATGLNEILLASAPSTQSRSATESKQRQSNASIRPEYMAKQVFHAMADGADMEKTLAMLQLRANDVSDIVGVSGAMLWDQNISNIPLDQVFREVRMTVVPEDLKLPNKDKDREALASILPTVFPEWSKYAEMTGDSGPLNALIGKVLKAAELDQDIEAIELGPMQPRQDPAQQEAMQQAQQMEMAKLQADVQKQQLAAQKSQVDLAKAQIDAQGKQSGVQASIAKDQSEMVLRQQEFGLKQGEHALKAAELQQKGQMGHVELAQAGVNLERSGVELQHARVDVAAAVQQAAMEQDKHEQDMRLAARQQRLAERTAAAQTRANNDG